MVEEDTWADCGWLAVHVGEGKYLISGSSIFNLTFTSLPYTCTRFPLLSV